MTDMLSTVGGVLIDAFKLYALILTLVSGTSFTRRFLRNWPYRHIKKILGVKNGDEVVLLCSELSDPEKRQWVEPREFIHLMKYGDVDALIEIIASLLRMYPDIDLKILTAHDTERVHVDLAKHVILVGGPDYNPLVRKLLDEGNSSITYHSEDIKSPSPSHPDEITLSEKLTNKEHFTLGQDDDVGYFERIVNPYSSKHNILFFGGCHTIGVTASAKAFSAYAGGRKELPTQVQKNAKTVAKRTKNASSFYIIFEAKKVGVNIAVPEISEHAVKIVSRKLGRMGKFIARFGATLALDKVSSGNKI
jgi:hypothetical protein